MKGYDVAVLSRTDNHDPINKVYGWDIEKNQIDMEALKYADYIIHLAGANIGEKRWTKKRKQLIIDSRIKTAQLIFDKINETKNKPKAFISASAIGFYGTTKTDRIFSESDPPSKDFLGETCRLWEESADRFEKIGIRTVKIRTAIVLTKQGGALSPLLQTVKLGIGSAIGDGKQFMPWIHIDDLCEIYIKAIEDAQMNGPYNAAAPHHTTNRDFMETLASILKKPFWFPNIPATFIKLIFGKMSVILLKGNRVSSEKITNAGYRFKFSNLGDALADITK